MERVAVLFRRTRNSENCSNALPFALTLTPPFGACAAPPTQVIFQVGQPQGFPATQVSSSQQDAQQPLGDGGAIPSNLLQ